MPSVDEGQIRDRRDVTYIAKDAEENNPQEEEECIPDECEWYPKNKRNHV